MHKISESTGRSKGYLRKTMIPPWLVFNNLNQRKPQPNFILIFHLELLKLENYTESTAQLKLPVCGTAKPCEKHLLKIELRLA